jgi:hypothetical protein
MLEGYQSICPACGNGDRINLIQSPPAVFQRGCFHPVEQEMTNPNRSRISFGVLQARSAESAGNSAFPNLC